ncbi:MAG: hypothetical protein EBU96_10360 [Actinobacteria bacterium]|nr:hypothetical protein [Actinomycetota bacterium]
MAQNPPRVYDGTTVFDFAGNSLYRFIPEEINTVAIAGTNMAVTTTGDLVLPGNLSTGKRKLYEKVYQSFIRPRFAETARGAKRLKRMRAKLAGNTAEIERKMAGVDFEPSPQKQALQELAVKYDDNYFEPTVKK